MLSQCGTKTTWEFAWFYIWKVIFVFVEKKNKVLAQQLAINQGSEVHQRENQGAQYIWKQNLPLRSSKLTFPISIVNKNKSDIIQVEKKM